MEELQPLFESNPDMGREKTKEKVSKRRGPVKKDEVLKMGEFVSVGENWIPQEEGDQIEGFVGPAHEITTSIGKAQAVIVGDKRVLISAGLAQLAGLEGAYVRITYQGKEKSKNRKGVEFRKFMVERRVEE